MRAYTVRYEMHVESQYDDYVNDQVTTLKPYAEVTIEDGFGVLAPGIPNALRKFADQLEEQMVEDCE
jgi:hypothetical protein